MKKIFYTSVLVFLCALAMASNIKAQNLSEDQNLSHGLLFLSELKTGQYGPIDYYEDWGSSGGWVKIEGPNFSFTSEKRLVSLPDDMMTESPKIFGGEINNQWLILVLTFSADNSIVSKSYIIDNLQNK